MNSKKILLYAVIPSLTMLTLGAIALPNAITPTVKGIGPVERTLTLDHSTSSIFATKTGEATGDTATSEGNDISFSVHYVTPTGETYDGALGGDHTLENNYTMHAKYGSYWCFITNDDPFSEITSVATTWSPEMSDRIDSFIIYKSSTPFTSYPTGEGIVKINSYGSGTAINLSGSDDHYFALAYNGYSAKDTADYYIDLSSIVIKYTC